ncbi:lipid-A-disaccharide synthase [bacterium]|nr:MAG: lipid-A-disaccharide synthase [bacterium]
MAFSVTMKTIQKSILIIAGESSGDIHGSGLIREIKKKNPAIACFGIGGDRMAEAGFDIVYHVSGMSFLGFIEVLKHLPFIRRVFRRMTRLLKEKNPSLVLLIDYPGFNLRFAKAAKNRGIPVLYYISPQVWAWGEKRVKKMARLIDRMIVIFPFEEDIYKKEGMDVQYVGHPLKDVVKPSLPKERFFKDLGMDPQHPTIGLLPGSRRQEVDHLLPEMLKACHGLQRKIPHLQLIVGLAPTLSDEVYRPLMKETDHIQMVRNRTYDVMAYADMVLVASGTATLETAILGTPMVILYKMSSLSYWIGRLLVKVKQIGLVNIVAGKSVVPELIQGEVRAEKIAKEAMDIMSNRQRREKMKKDLKEVSHILGEKGASERAAKSVIEFINRPPILNTFARSGEVNR